MPNGLSSLAHLVLRNTAFKNSSKRTAAVFGMAVHQTGGTEAREALTVGADVLEYLVEYYRKPDSYYAHYVIGYDGTIVQIADEAIKAPHVGFEPEDRASFLSGTWKQQLGPAGTLLWQTYHNGLKSPAHAFPGPSPNNVYVGVELIPIVARQASPDTPGQLFTTKQYLALRDLARDFAARQNMPGGWQHTWRLHTHEGLNPLRRMSTNPVAGWDPGFMRTQPWFDMRALRDAI